MNPSTCFAPPAMYSVHRLRADPVGSRVHMHVFDNLVDVAVKRCSNDTLFIFTKCQRCFFQTGHL